MHQSTGVTSQSAVFPFESRYTTVAGHKIHYVEEGRGGPVLFLHGNPTSSYVWRNVLPALAARAGWRCIALDLLGFGKSDKPNINYSLRLHADIVAGFIANLGLKNLVLVAEDWGGPLGADYAARSPQNVAGMALMETFLWPMQWVRDFPPEFRTPFKLLRTPLGFVMIQVMNFMSKKMIPRHCPIAKESLDYYINSCPTVRSRRAMREFPKLLPVEGEPRESFDFIMQLQEGLARASFPIVWFKATPGVVPSDDYPSTMQGFEELKKKVPRIVVRDFGSGLHFLSEVNPARVVEMLAEWLGEIAQSGETLRGVMAVSTSKSFQTQLRLGRPSDAV